MAIKSVVFFFPYILLFITLCMSPAQSGYYTASEPYNPVQLKKTYLHFFLHETLSGTNPSAVRIAGPSVTKDNPIPFGALFAMDDLMTEEPEITSKLVGNARGLYLSSSRGEDASLVLYADFAFTTGEFAGSSLSLFSRNPVMEKSREMAVVGGKGKFRMATGTASVMSYWRDITTGDSILEYTVEVVYSEGVKPVIPSF